MRQLLIDADAVGAGTVALEPAGFFLSPPGYPGDLPCPAKGAGVKSYDDENQSTLQCGTMGIWEKRYGEAELH